MAKTIQYCKVKKKKNKNKIIGTKSLLYNTTVSFMLNFTVTEIWFKYDRNGPVFS